MTTECSVLKSFYEDPTQSGRENGVQIYGDVDMFFQSLGGCDINTPPEIIYNHYCITQSGNSVFKDGCAQYLNDSGAKDKPMLIYNKILDENYPDFNYTYISQFASFCTHPSLGINTSSPNVQSSFSGNITASITTSGTLLVALGGATELVATSVTTAIQFTMANDTGLIYYIDNSGQTFGFVPQTGKSTLLSTMAIPFSPQTMLASAIPGLGLAVLCSGDLSNVYRFQFSTGTWTAIPITGGPFFAYNTQMAIDMVGDTLVFGANTGLGQPFKPFIVTSFASATSASLIGFLPSTASFFGCSPLLLRNNNTGNLEILSIWQDINGLSSIKIGDIINATVTIIPQPILDDNKLDTVPILGIAWSNQRNQFTCFTKYNGTFYCAIQPSSTNQWTKISFSIQTTHNAQGNLPVSVTVSNQMLFWSEYIPGAAQYSIRVATFNADSLSFFFNSLASLGFFYLLDNGELRCYESESLTAKLLWCSSTNDQSSPSNTLINNGNYVLVTPQDNPLTISKNGLYGLSSDPKTKIVKLFQNAINTQQIVTWGGQDKLPALRNSYQLNYCSFLPKNQQTGTITDTFPDPRCLCYYPRELTASLFNVDLLSANPAQLKLVDSISPCLFGTCTASKGNGTITSSLMTQVVQCPTTINLCSTIIQLGQDSSINAGKGGINIDNNCGGASGKTPCSSTCPVGMGCAKDNFCSLLCDNNSDCIGLGGNCSKGVCQLNSSSSGGLPDWGIALIVIGVFLVLLGIALGIYYTRKR
jgi:hypothetical protein